MSCWFSREITFTLYSDSHGWYEEYNLLNYIIGYLMLCRFSLSKHFSAVASFIVFSRHVCNYVALVRSGVTKITGETLAPSDFNEIRAVATRLSPVRRVKRLVYKTFFENF